MRMSANPDDEAALHLQHKGPTNMIDKSKWDRFAVMYGGKLSDNPAKARNAQMNVYCAAAQHVRVANAIETWKREENLTYLSPEACRRLVDQIVKELS